jgi:hypothetical protein
MIVFGDNTDSNPQEGENDKPCALALPLYHLIKYPLLLKACRIAGLPPQLHARIMIRL